MRHKRRCDGSGWRWEQLREAVLSDEPLCRPCAEAGRTMAANEVDHIVPLHLGGTDERSNLQPICGGAPGTCHEIKTRKERLALHPPKGSTADGVPLARLVI